MQTPKAKAPFFLASLMAAKVSAVSPDCEIAMTMSLSEIMGFLYRNSEAAGQSQVQPHSKTVLPGDKYVNEANRMLRYDFGVADAAATKEYV